MSKSKDHSCSLNLQSLRRDRVILILLRSSDPSVLLDEFQRS